jgi:hypothetical protein
MQRLFFVLCGLLLAGCTGGAVVFAPTPLPPDISPMLYTAPGSVFSLVLPRNWSVFEQTQPSIVTVSFAPPESATPLLTVAVINTGALVEGVLLDLVEQYQTQVRPDLERYTEQNREVMGDNSWRMTGVRALPGGTTQSVNTFVQGSGTMLAVIEIIVPTEPTVQQELEAFLNTFTLASTSELPRTSLAALAGTAAAGLEVVNLLVWTAPNNVFFITGEVANHTAQPIASVPVRAILLDEQGKGIAEAVDIVMGHAAPPGGFAPFSLRFGQGQPQEARGFDVTLGSSDWQPEVINLAPADALEWEAGTQFSPDGSLFITGTVRNVSGTILQKPRAIVTVFDDANRVIAAGFADADEAVLLPDGTANYTILVPETGGTPANFIVQVQALTCAEDDC